MLKPAYKLTVGKKVIDTTDKPQASTVVRLVVTLDLETPADSLELTLGNVGSFSPQLDDAVTVELGYADNGGFTKVLTGTVTAIDPSVTTTRVSAYAGAAPLLRTFVDQTFENKTAGAIVKELAARASVGVATAADGITFPAYVIDGRRSVHTHMLDLAELCGFDLYLNPDGQLVFEPFTTGKIVHVFEHSKHILQLEFTQSLPRFSQVQAFGESPGAGKSDEAWAWLTKDFSGLKGSAGSTAKDGAVLLLERPALRTAAAARTAANAALTGIRDRTLRGRLLSVGRPEVKLGDAIRLRGLPRDALNGLYQVRDVTHRITKGAGFTTAVGFRSLST